MALMDDMREDIFDPAGSQICCQTGKTIGKTFRAFPCVSLLSVAFYKNVINCKSGVRKKLNAIECI
jgi:hypothetical protein